MNTLRRLWHDPVWSKVIAGVILSTIGALWLVRNQLALHTINLLFWLSSNVTLSHWSIVGWFLSGGVIGIVGSYVVALGQARRFNSSPRKEVVAPAVSAKVAESGTTDQERPVDKDFVPNDTQAEVLWKMLNIYPQEIDLAQAHAAMKTLTPAHAEREMESLELAKVIRIRRVNENAQYYRVTSPGRDFVLKWLAKELGDDSIHR